MLDSPVTLETLGFGSTMAHRYNPRLSDPGSNEIIRGSTVDMLSTCVEFIRGHGFCLPHC